MMKRIAVVVLLALLAFGSFGCGKLREKLAGKAVEEGSSGQVTVSGSSGNVTVTTPTGTAQVTSGGGASLPDGWPSSVPVYPGAKIQSAMGTPAGKTIILTTTDPASKVHDYYKSELKGFKLAADINANGATVMSFKDGAKAVAVNITANAVTVSVAGF